MAHIDRNKAVENAGGQHELILMAAHRAREIQNGDTPRIAEDHSPPVIALKEIECGLYTVEEYNNRHLKDLFADESIAFDTDKV